MAISNVDLMESDNVSQGDCSCSSETTAGTENSTSEDDGKGIQIKIKRAIENGILDDEKKKRKRKLLNFDRSFKKRKNLKIEQEGFRINIRKFRLFKIDHVKKKGEEMLPPARNDRDGPTGADAENVGAAE
ncbi:conserved Plasmodium protein, unknown function [Plasmodium knowlesi strain H]|uniref:Uncharacterized protein n=3 Tax=Plasmodium knowlesi TaxID=5850 RepID=A0A5K1UVG5_PLAKH|nr:conserved Plasmodium protein, unknown function [Plasmodium knowlesi strain H]OTN68005.1 Uncharacterized protein PKNOH_S04366200 [Plasmodium knowlesi]CAA9987022.1 conserved Plasmodium protein, unknown function [Plasmodium knowlesi strain H]SBO26692.1 conserved Plasmodium protein, unknown function [Plasmodium knowlesi strain H]SBO28227.1 conserved Plasmodium protein, unknown function [Plasmodium knowlesi strain H]VVS76496.1 conserved Plasmodium protein, unknown function [Plasmodium knowlesi s|eukprot:XP_002258267.1 hypothetical protein, conserved in Plasmodium species [Plasmodium knowlesi strain H]